MNDNLAGSEIVNLLNEGLDVSVPMPAHVKEVYEAAENRLLHHPKKAIELCEKMIQDGFEKGPSSDISNLLAPKYIKGKFQLLLASIYLNSNMNLKLAAEYYDESKNELRLWFQLSALANLGLAISKRKLNDFDRAISACNSAHGILGGETIMPDQVDKDALTSLAKAIDRELLTIRRMILVKSDYLRLEGQGGTALLAPTSEEGDPAPAIDEADPATKTDISAEEDKRLPIFKISTGDGLIAVGGTTSLNLLCPEDYQQNLEATEIVLIDLVKRPEAKKVDYILEVDEEVQTRDGLKQGDWLLIRAESNPEKLNGKTVAVLVRNNDQVCASLKTFFKAEDHYFLKSRSETIIVAHYSSDLSKISKYYTIDNEKILGKLAYDVPVSAIVVKRIPQKSVRNIVKSYIWRLPLVSRINAGTLWPIPEEDVKEYKELRENQRQDANYFLVSVDGESMTSSGILPNSTVLIRQQENVENGEVAALVIKTRKQSVGVLKQYYALQRWHDIRHWLLVSSNPAYENLVVIPNDVDVTKIKNFYAKRLPKGKCRFLDNAELVIAGKYIRTVDTN